MALQKGEREREREKESKNEGILARNRRFKCAAILREFPRIIVDFSNLKLNANILDLILDIQRTFSISISCGIPHSLEHKNVLMRLIIFCVEMFLRVWRTKSLISLLFNEKNKKRNVFFMTFVISVRNDCMGLYRGSRALLGLTLQHSDENNAFLQCLTTQLKPRLSVIMFN